MCRGPVCSSPLCPCPQAAVLCLAPLTGLRGLWLPEYVASRPQLAALQSHLAASGPALVSLRPITQGGSGGVWALPGCRSLAAAGGGVCVAVLGGLATRLFGYGARQVHRQGLRPRSRSSRGKPGFDCTPCFAVCSFATQVTLRCADHEVSCRAHDDRSFLCACPSCAEALSLDCEPPLHTRGFRPIAQAMWPPCCCGPLCAEPVAPAHAARLPRPGRPT
jgi:hypothetical protein